MDITLTWQNGNRKQIHLILLEILIQFNMFLIGSYHSFNMLKKKKKKRTKAKRRRKVSFVLELVKFKLHIIFPHHRDKGFLSCWTSSLLVPLNKKKTTTKKKARTNPKTQIADSSEKSEAARYDTTS